jgi:hypothetical protein
MTTQADRHRRALTGRLLRMVAAACCALAPLAVPAQGPVRLDGGGALEVGGEGERYLRALQLAGGAPLTGWTVRPVHPLAAWALRADSAHPWRGRWGAADSGVAAARLLRPGAKLSWNSSYPSGDGRGPAWTGRGATIELRAGGGARLGPLRVQLAPVAFLAQNSAFAAVTSGGDGSGAFKDPRFPGNIDLPQRFGSGAYGRLDPGNSTLALLLPGVETGLSSAAQVWGPGREYPLVLSGNAGGFPHAFVGTRGPLPIGVGQVQGRVMVGRPRETRWSPMAGDPRTRWTMAAVGTFTPRGVPGLEIGGIRAIHGLNQGRFPPSAVRRLLSGGTYQGQGFENLSDENQMASLFLRWAFPRAGMEVYGEYFRDDYSLDGRRALQYPDDLRSYMVGAQRVLSFTPERLRVWRVELVNGELPASNRGERSGNFAGGTGTPIPPYVHSGVTQGHTHAGLLLGAPEAYGGAAWRTGVDQFMPAGRLSVTLERALRLDWLPGVAQQRNQVTRDVVYAVGAEMVRFVGGAEVGGAATAMVELNRNLVRRNDAPNLRLALWWRGF